MLFMFFMNDDGSWESITDHWARKKRLALNYGLRNRECFRECKFSTNDLIMFEENLVIPIV